MVITLSFLQQLEVFYIIFVDIYTTAQFYFDLQNFVSLQSLWLWFPEFFSFFPTKRIIFITLDRIGVILTFKLVNNFTIAEMR
jgi:hypothetical protein